MNAILAVATILGGITALWFLVEKREALFNVWRFRSFERELSIFVNDFGLLDQKETELIKKLEKASAFLSKSKSYAIKVENKKYKKQLDGQSENGINKELQATISEKLNDTGKALKLLINLKSNEYLQEFSDTEFIDMVKGTLKYSDLSPYNPLLDRLDIWFKGNKAFRTTIEFSSTELQDLFQALKISDLFQIMGGSVVELPRTTLCGKVIPAIVYSLEKYSDQSLNWQTEEHFKIELWNYGVA